MLHHQPRLTTKQATKELESWLLETLPQRQNDRPPGPASKPANQPPLMACPMACCHSVTGCEPVKQYLQLHQAGEQREHFAVMYLDSQNRLIAFQVHFTGTLSQTSVYPREIVLAALGYNAGAVVLAHNHPAGNVTPSRADECLTQTIKAALALVDVRVLDHVIAWLWRLQDQGVANLHVEP